MRVINQGTAKRFQAFAQKILIVTFVLLCSHNANARAATPDDVDMYVDAYAESVEDIFDTCTAFYNSREQDTCFAQHKARWDRRWQGDHPFEFDKNQTTDLKQRVAEVDRNIKQERDEINKQREKEDSLDGDDVAAPPN